MTCDKLFSELLQGSLKHEVILISLLSKAGDAPGLKVLSCDIPFK
jgi:hypothetical protein